MSRLLTKEEIEALLASGPIMPAPVEQLQIVIEAGRTEIPFGALSALKPGSMLPLNTAAGAPVEVVANGTTVAYGRLVPVEGRTCVRIVSLPKPGTTTRRSVR